MQTDEAGQTDEASSAATHGGPPEECDLVMEGGVTSGVVYPLALVDLASRYLSDPVLRRPAALETEFAISLAQFDPLRNGPDPNRSEDRVFLPVKAGAGIAEPINPVRSIRDFAAAILTKCERQWTHSPM